MIFTIRIIATVYVVVVVDVIRRDVKPKEKVTLTLRLVGNIEPDEDGRSLMMNFAFSCVELSSGITGAYNLELHVAKWKVKVTRVLG